MFKLPVLKVTDLRSFWKTKQDLRHDLRAQPIGEIRHVLQYLPERAGHFGYEHLPNVLHFENICLMLHTMLPFSE
jgi:hypothetical protein